MRKELIRIGLVVFFCFATSALFAQPGDPGGDPDVPISGIWLLLAGGAGYGAKKVYDMARRRK